MNKKFIAMSVLVIGSVMGMSGPASASTMDESLNALSELTDATNYAGQQKTPSGMKRACVGVETAAYDFLALSKPIALPSISWKHTRKAAKFTAKSAIACQSGDFDTAGDYANRSANEFELASAFLK